MSKQATQENEQLTDAMFYILLALLEERYGYVIMKYIEELSDGMMQMGPGTLYTLLKKLTKLQWIQQLTSDSRTKTYLITQEGKRILCQEGKRRERMVEDANKALKKGIV